VSPPRLAVALLLVLTTALFVLYLVLYGLPPVILYGLG
jgi:hypothetical protein